MNWGGCYVAQAADQQWIGSSRGRVTGSQGRQSLRPISCHAVCLPACRRPWRALGLQEGPGPGALGSRPTEAARAAALAIWNIPHPWRASGLLAPTPVIVWCRAGDGGCRGASAQPEEPPHWEVNQGHAPGACGQWTVNEGRTVLASVTSCPPSSVGHTWLLKKSWLLNCFM